MEIFCCPSIGFCDGVKHALEKARALSAQGFQVFVDGFLIHNHHVLDELRQENIWSAPIEKLLPIIQEKRLHHPCCLLIRAHGTTLQRRNWLKSLNLPLFDATCKEVGKIAGKIRRLDNDGFTLFLFGDPDHPEVQGLLSYAKKYPITVCQTQKQFEKIADQYKNRSRIGLLCQTTSSRENFNNFIQAFRRHFPQGQVIDSLCQSTEQRQRELAEAIDRFQPDQVLIVGGKNSSNSQRLKQVAEKKGISSILLEELRPQVEKTLSTAKRLVLASGTSTPETQVREIGEALLEQGSEPQPQREK